MLPSPRLRRLLSVLFFLTLVHVVELWRHGHPLMAAAMLASAGVAAWAQRRTGTISGRPHRLVLAADGRLFLLLQGGVVEQATLEPGSLRLGRSLLFVLRCNRCRHRLLLGPDNLAPAQLAALQRRLPRRQGP